MHRFFVDPERLQGETVALSGPQARQIRDVLRLRPGDRIVLLDGSGWEHQAELIAIERDRAEARILQRLLSSNEPRTKITLYQAILEGQKFELVLQKGTELGVVAFVPVVAQRCLVASLEDIGEQKQARWRRIIVEAAEQSRRGRLPILRPALLLRQAWEEAAWGGTTLVPWEGPPQADASGGRSLRAALLESARGGQRPFSINLFIGPEVGFTEQEIAQGQRYGAIPVSLGPRILRAETAGLVAAAAILYELGDLGP